MLDANLRVKWFSEAVQIRHKTLEAKSIIYMASRRWKGYGSFRKIYREVCGRILCDLISQLLQANLVNPCHRSSSDTPGGSGPCAANGPNHVSNLPRGCEGFSVVR